MPWHGSRMLRNDWIEKQTKHLVPLEKKNEDRLKQRSQPVHQTGSASEVRE
jgi:hypothetical protein